MLYNLRKRKGPVAAASKAVEPVEPPDAAQPRGLATAAASQPSSGPSTSMATADSAVPATPDELMDTPASALLPAAAAASPAAPQKKQRQWEDVGLKVDTSQLLLGVGGTAPAAGAPTADAPLVTSAMRALAARGFTHEMLSAACQHLAQADEKLVPYIQQYGPPERLLAKTAPCFASLAKSIVFQQLATAAAAAIFGRVLQVCQCEEQLTPEAIVAAPVDQLRGSGLSQRKVEYLLDLSRHFQEGHLSDERIAALDDASLHRELVKVKGIGPWSVDMFAMFHLGHTDILPVGDLGVRRGMQVLYGLKDLPDAAAMARIAECWRPYRSVGSYYMWRVEVPRSAQTKEKKGGKAKTGATSSSRTPM